VAEGGGHLIGAGVPNGSRYNGWGWWSQCRGGVEGDRRHIPNGAVRAVTRHTSDAMLAVYDRPGELFSGSAGAYFEGV